MRSDPEPCIFVVDDDAGVRDSLSTLLDACGLPSACYESGRAFLQEISSEHRGCVVLDVRLPDMTGLDVLRHLAARNIGLPVIVITAFADVPLAVGAMKAGAVDFIQKPYADQVLLDSVQAALQETGRPGPKDATAAELAHRLARLTPREREVMEALVLGRQNKQIAWDLGISPRTVEIHRARVLEKMEASTHSHLVRMVVSARASGR